MEALTGNEVKAMAEETNYKAATTITLPKSTKAKEKARTTTSRVAREAIEAEAEAEVKEAAAEAEAATEEVTNVA